MIKKRITIDVEITLGDSFSPKDFLLERKFFSQSLDSIVCSVIRGDFILTDKVEKFLGSSMSVKDINCFKS